MNEDSLKVLAFGRQSMATQLNEKLKSIEPIDWNLTFKFCTIIFVYLYFSVTT